MECLWASWAEQLFMLYMVLEALPLDMVRRAAGISVHSFSPFTAASADVVGVVVDMMVDIVDFLRQIFRVRWLAEWVVAPAVLCHCCGLSLAAGWMAAASALWLVLRAIAVGCWKLTAALVRGGLVDARWHHGCARNDFVHCSSGHDCRKLWSATLCRRLLSLSSAAPQWRSRSVAWTRCCVVLQEWLRLGDCTLGWFVPLLLLGGLPVAAATDNHDGQAAIITAVLTATFWCVVGGICWLAALSKLIRFGGILWTDYHQPCQAAVAEEVAAAVSSTCSRGSRSRASFSRGYRKGGWCSSSEVQWLHQRQLRWCPTGGNAMCRSGSVHGHKEGWKHLRRARYWWSAAARRSR